MRTIAAAALLFLLLSPPGGRAPAQGRGQPIDEVAADLAYGLCPLFLAGQLSLTGPELAGRGFGTTILKQPHPRIGEMNLVNARLADGEIAFGGAAGKACTVVVKSPRRAAVLSTLHRNMAYTGLDFKPAPAPGPAVAGVPSSAIETFKAPAGGQFLYVQLVSVSGPGGAGPVVAQLFVTDR
jgi:hypothetical protein